MHALQLSNVSFALRRLLVGLLSLAVLATLWHLVVVGLRVPAYLAPTPSAILHAAIKNWKILAAQTGFTLGAAAIGLSISTLFAVGIAVAFSMSRRLAQASLPILIAFRSTPVVALSKSCVSMARRAGSSCGSSGYPPRCRVCSPAC